MGWQDLQRGVVQYFDTKFFSATLTMSEFSLMARCSGNFPNKSGWTMKKKGRRAVCSWLELSARRTWTWRSKLCGKWNVWWLCKLKANKSRYVDDRFRFIKLTIFWRKIALPHAKYPIKYLTLEFKRKIIATKQHKLQHYKSWWCF